MLEKELLEKVEKLVEKDKLEEYIRESKDIIGEGYWELYENEYDMNLDIILYFDNI